MKFKHFVSIWLIGLTCLLSIPSQGYAQTEQPLATDDAIILVPNEVSNLQDAIKQVPDGGVIELSPGTYENGSKNFLINNLSKGFTIRGASEGSVILTGSGRHDVFRFLNSSLEKGKMVYFLNLTFANGYSATDGVSGGMTMRYAQATFTNCTFQDNNGNQPSTGGGGIVVADKSKGYFNNTHFINNRAKFYAGGLGVAEGSMASLVNADFRGNRTNFPGHNTYSSGGGIHVGNSTLYVANSHFEDNESGYVAGAIYAAGIWQSPYQTPRTYVSVDNSTFINNRARKDPGVSQASPTEAGAIHAEDQAFLVITNSRFITNSADTGGAVNTYRGQIEIYNSVFLGNQAVGSGGGKAFGGSISILSSDGSGNVNYPSARLKVKNVYIQGRYGSITSSGMAAGGIYAAGDFNRQYGINIPQMGTLSENRAKVSLENVILNDLDVVMSPDNQDGTGTGGALVTDMAEATLTNVLVMNSDASGPKGQGGGLMFLNQSLGWLTNVTIAKNKATLYGGGLFVQGSEIHVTKSRFFENEISPGTNEPSSQSYGAAIFAAPDDGRNNWATGEVRESVLTNNTGLPIFDDDRGGTPVRINEVRYNANKFFNSTFSDLVYTDSISGSYYSNAAQLNNLVVNRSNGTQTDKSQENNTQENNPINNGTILASIPVLYSVYGLQTVYLAYAWSGGSGSVNGTPVSGNTGTTTTTTPGTYTLSVNGTPYQVSVTVIKPSLFIPWISR